MLPKLVKSYSDFFVAFCCASNTLKLLEVALGKRRMVRPNSLAYSVDIMLSPQPVSMIIRGPFHGAAPELDVEDFEDVGLTEN